ncbi:MAG TPA: hypothetical protein VLX28_13705, partial [Thermoanaerobaculia bacterium]|nr:hypothetical protein [Thermoanaerobaculia bacterium]
MHLFNRQWFRRKPVVFSLTLAPIVLIAGSWMTLDHLEREGKQFFDTGRAAVMALDRLSGALTRRDFAAASEVYAPGFQGSPLGLANLRPVGEKDGIATLSFAAAKDTKGTADRGAAVEEWRTYLDGFSAIEEIGLHLHRVEAWEAGGEVTGLVRFEVIGTPKGHARSGIDRALFRMHFVPGREGLQIAAASPLEGERLVADRPPVR